MIEDELTFQKLKMVYDKVADHHKYYLSWRQYLLGGFFAISGSLVYSAYYLYSHENYSAYSCFPFSLLTGLAIFFLELDKRNMDLYHVCQRVGSRIEQVLFLIEADLKNNDLFSLNEKSKDNVALFFTLDNSRNHPKEEVNSKESLRPTHSLLISLFYYSISIISFIFFFFLFFFKTLKFCSCII